MAYSEEVAGRIREMFEKNICVTEKKMFGGIAFMINGNMSVGVLDEEIVLRLGNEGVAEALTEPHTRPMDFTGKPIRSMLFVEKEGFVSDKDLQAWMQKAITFALTLPPK